MTPRRAGEAGRLAGRRGVLVAGAGRGIGSAVAERCAQDGAEHLTLLGRTRQELDDVAARVRAAGAGASVAVCDLTDVAAARAAVLAAPALDVVVVNAGTNRPEPFTDVSEEAFDAIMGLNVRAAFFVAQAAARRMRAEATRGVIVFLSSQMGHVGAERRTVYCASKHAVEGLVKATALELAADGIRVVSVAPTFVRTSMTAEQLDDPELAAALRAQIPLGRWMRPAEVADAVSWVAGDGAAMLTGSSLVLDGGWTAR